jgi:outer membrane protein TolC
MKLLCLVVGVCLTSGAPAVLQAQQAAATTVTASDATTVAAPAASTAISLEDAINRAKANAPGFAAAVAASRVSALDASIARSALLPNVVYNNQYIFTESNGSNANGTIYHPGVGGIQSAPRFIANNAVHEYLSQGSVTETIGVQQVTAASRASATSAIATAELEIARRGLVATVVGLYYGSLAADERVGVARRAADEANDFTTQTQQREAAREAAHADVLKAELQQQQHGRELADALLQQQRSHLELGVLLFPDPRAPYTLSAPATPSALGTRAEIESAANLRNPELQSAVASLRASDLDVRSAKAAYLPDLALNYTYGIDAERFAERSADGLPNLGYSASATLDIPVWDWFATAHRIKQKEILRDSAHVTLDATQRRLIAQLDESYAEASTARDQIDSLALSVRTATESLRLTRMRYTAGEATVLEVVDAQNSLIVAELAHEDGIVRYRTALANLQLLTGTI